MTISCLEYILKGCLDESQNTSSSFTSTHLSTLDKNINLAIGKFDTLHKGHQAIITKLREFPGKTGLLCFDPNPNKFFNPTIKNYLILPPKLKLHVLSELGVDYLFLAKFDKELVKLSANQFMEKYLYPLAPKNIIVGEDFRFGYKRLGTTDNLEKFCLKNKIGFHVKSLEAKTENGFGNSHYLKSLISRGEVSKFYRLVGRNYMIFGRVETGAKLGRKLGFRTANILFDQSQVLPKYGVYLVKARFAKKNITNTNQTTKVSNKILEKVYYGVANLGVKPTINKNTSQESLRVIFEVHLFDKMKDFYNKDLLVELVFFIRPEKKFANLDLLKEQIELDIKVAKKEITHS